MALRQFRATPLFTVVAVASLALGIGANAAIFSLIDQLLLESLPVERPGELVQLAQEGSHYGSNSGPRMHSYPIYRDFRDTSPVHAGLLARREVAMAVTFGGVAERVMGELVSGNYFEVLGVKAYRGRVLSGKEDEKKGGRPVVVLGYDYWKTRFAGDEAIVGKELLVNNYRMTVIGVSAPEFFGLDPTRSVSVRVPIEMREQLAPDSNDTEDRRSRWVQVFGRLKPGMGIERAQAQMQMQFTAIRQAEVKEAAFARAAPETVREFLKGRLVLHRAANGYSGLGREMAQPLWVLMALVGLVLMIACTNVANLLIARAMGRRKELAVRAALGASRWRLMRPLLIESTLLSLAGGVGGLGLAYALNSLLLSYLPVGQTPLRIEALPDWRVLGFSFGVALVTGMLFGLLPAWTAGRTDAGPALKEEGRSVSAGGSSWLRKGLVSAQVALSVLLLIAAGLFVRTLENLKATQSGLETRRLVTFQADLGNQGYSVERVKEFFREFRERAGAVAGVESVAVATIAKMSGNEWDSTVTVEGYKHDPERMPDPYFDAVTPGYVETMGMKILSGRDFRDSDRNTEVIGNIFRPTWKVCMINKKFADQYFAGRNPVGYHLGFGGDPGTKTDIEIVGVFSDAKYMDLREEVMPQVLVPAYETGFRMPMVAYVRTRSGEAEAFGQMRGVLREMDSGLPIYAMRSFEQQVETILARERLMGFLASVFGVVATVLAAIGLYGVLALAVRRRLREIGIRLALGAAPQGILRLVMSEVVYLVGAGLAAGLTVAAMLSRFVESQLYGLEGIDVATYGGAVALMLAVAALAGLGPARKATGVNPIEVLRYERGR